MRRNGLVTKQTRTGEYLRHRSPTVVTTTKIAPHHGFCVHSLAALKLLHNLALWGAILMVFMKETAVLLMHRPIIAAAERRGHTTSRSLAKGFLDCPLTALAPTDCVFLYLLVQHTSVFTCNVSVYLSSKPYLSVGP